MLTIVMVIATLVYPLVIGYGHAQIEPRFLAGMLLLVALTRLPFLKLSNAWQWLLGGTLLLLILAVGANALLPLKLYPVLVNAIMFGAFGYSLIYPPSMVERFARIREPNLPNEAIGYTRNVTIIWSFFFAVNGAIAFITALWTSAATWSLYNGFIAYLLMGLLFAGEYLVRLRFKARLHA
jgi:uncharacterized membrane protein